MHTARKNSPIWKQPLGSGFTLIEILVVIGIIAILAAVVLVAINPARQFKQAHDSARRANLDAILDAIGQNMIDHGGEFDCTAGTLPSTPTDMASAGYDIRGCLVPVYIAEVPVDPSAAGAAAWDGTSYDTKYLVSEDASTSRVTVSAVGELTPHISVTR